MTRTDVHRPSAINPADYRWVAFEHTPSTGDPMADAAWQLEQRQTIRCDMERTGGTYSRHQHGGNCMVCGNANAIYTILFHHEPTNSYVRMGQDCAEKVEADYDGEAFRHWQKRVRKGLELVAGKNKARMELEAHGLTQAWDVFSNPPSEGLYEENTIYDIVGKLVKYGSISDKQFAFLHVLLKKINTRKEREALRRAETEAAKPIPAELLEGRVTVEGEVLTVKQVETNFGIATKMLLKHADGWKIWGSVPGGSGVVSRGDKIRVTGRIDKSPDDPKFGFLSRPTKLITLEAAVAAS